MTLPVVSSAVLMCPFGLAPSTLNVLPADATVMESRPPATIMDHVPFINIMPFGLCTSLANPVTAAQTTAALGVLTPGACTPVVPAPWMPGSPTVLIRNKPALTQTSKCFCIYGGVITVAVPGATTEQLP
jgi:hypothetical protein